MATSKSGRVALVGAGIAHGAAKTLRRTHSGFRCSILHIRPVVCVPFVESSSWIHNRYIRKEGMHSQHLSLHT